MSLKRKIEEVEEDAKEHRPKKLKLGNEVDESANVSTLSFSFSSLPLEIFSHHILKFFDFRDWLKLVVVCKQWQLAAQQSTLNKQLVYRVYLDEEVACSIISKYQVNTLVIATDISLKQLQTLLASSPSITTLVTDTGEVVTLTDSSEVCRQFHQLTTLSTTTKCLFLLKHCPNIRKLRLLVHFNPNHKSDEWHDSVKQGDLNGHVYHSVQELEINVTTDSVNSEHQEHFKSIKGAFPSLKKLYMNYEHNDRPLKTLEEVSKQLNITIIHDNPHLSLYHVNEFSFKSLSYHEYFNGFGQTPLQAFLNHEDGELEFCKQLFQKYSSRKYEKHLYHREPQFYFPLRCPIFNPTSTRVGLLRKNVLLAMVECRYIDYWRALSSKDLRRTYSKKQMINLLRQSVNYMPPTHHAIESIPLILKTVPKMSIVDVIGAIGSDAFNMIASLRTKKGDTLLHRYAPQWKVFSSDFFELVAPNCDVQALNHRNENAATVAFSKSNWSFWTQLVTNGIPVQGELYHSESLEQFLSDTVLHTEPLSILHMLDQPLIQRLLWQLASLADSLYRKEQRFKDVFSELVRLGAAPREKGDNEPLVCVMAKRERLQKHWSLIEHHKLDLNEANQEGYTPLMISLKMELLSQAEYLLTHGADPNICTTNSDGKTNCAVFLLNKVSTNLEKRFTDLLQRYSANFAVEDARGNTVVNRAALKRDRINTTILPLVPIDQPNHEGYTPLANAVMRAPTCVIQQLIAAGADPNVAVGHLRQPLLALALDSGHDCGYETVYELLSSQKIDVRSTDQGNRSFIYYLTKASPVFVYMLVHDKNGSLLSLLKDHYNTPENISFIKLEVNNVLTTPELSHFKTRLMCIALTSIELITFLIDVLGVDVNVEDQNGDTLLTLFGAGTKCYDNTSEVVEFLLSRGANVNHQNKQGNTALMLAIENRIMVHNKKGKQKHLKKKLIKAGSSLTIENVWGISPLKADPSLKAYGND